QGLHEHDLLRAARPAEAARPGHAADHDAGRVPGEADEAVRTGNPTVREHDGGPRRRARADRPARDGRHREHAAGRACADPDGDCDPDPGGVRRIPAGVHLRDAADRVLRADPARALAGLRNGGPGAVRAVGAVGAGWREPMSPAADSGCIRWVGRESGDSPATKNDTGERGRSHAPAPTALTAPTARRTKKGSASPRDAPSTSRRSRGIVVTSRTGVRWRPWVLRDREAAAGRGADGAA